MGKITIFLNGKAFDAELFDTACARAIEETLPIETRPNEWGDEFYFEIPARLDLDETATQSVKRGDIGYWPPGHALAIFFGPTPASTGPDPVAASPVNIVGRVTANPATLKSGKGASKVRIERVQPSE